uniref:Uncharacterized protein n=1 Tax=Oryza punctata TaxID=4537 RepID=A0A0E0M5K4_ORYPU
MEISVIFFNSGQPLPSSILFSPVSVDRAADVIPGVVPCRHGASPSLRLCGHPKPSPVSR